MFQNIQEVQGKIDYSEEKKKLNIFSNIIAKNNIILYIIVFMVSTIGIGQDMSPFSIAITAACMAAGVPIFGIAVCGIVGNSIAFGTSGALNYMITLLVMIITIFVAKPIYNDENRNEKIKIAKNVFLSVFIVEVVKLFMIQFSLYDAMMLVTISLVTVVFYKIFVNSIVVIQEFNEHSAFSIEEVIGASLLLAIAFSALGEFAIFGLSVRNILSILIVLILGWKNGVVLGTTSGVAIGVTLGIIAEIEPVMIAAFAISGMIAGVLNRFGKIGVIAGFLVGSGVLAYISNGGTSDLIVFKEILVASIGLLAMPKSININIKDFYGGANLLPISPYGALTRSKEKETVDKLNNVSSAIKDIADTYSEEVQDDEILASNRNIFVAELLNQLENKQDNMLYEDLTKMENPITDELFSILVKKQEIDRKDLLETFAKFNSYIVATEDNEISKQLDENIEDVVKYVNNAYKISKSNFVLQKKLLEKKKNMSTQLGEVSKAISNMADEIEKDIKSEDEFKNKKTETLSIMAQTNIKLEDVIIKKSNNGRITVDIHPKSELQNSQKEKINKIVSNVLKEKLVVSNVYEPNTLRLISEDKFLITVGMAKATKNGNVVSGDNMLKGRLKDGKYIFAISDGMGAGEDANKSSGLALSMLEKLISSGFDKNTSVELINGALLNSSEKEIFATLDVAIADLYTGNIEFLKNGACPTYIKNKKRINLVKSVTLPTGIIDKVDLCLYDKDIESGDILVMCSDGILDSNVEYKNKELWLKYLLEDIESDDSQKIADLILNEAIDNNYGVAKDDMSVIVCKFTRR